MFVVVGSAIGDLQSTEALSKYATLPPKHVLQTSDQEKPYVSGNVTTSPATSYPDFTDENSSTFNNIQSTESRDVLPELIKTDQSFSDEKTYVETINIKSDLLISTSARDNATTISVSNQSEGVTNHFSSNHTDSEHSTSTNYAETSEPRSASKREELKSESAINPIQFTPISPTVVPNIKTFSDMLDEAKTCQSSSIDMSPTRDGNPFETYEPSDVDSLDSSPTSDGNPFETNDSSPVESVDAAFEREKLINARESDYNENTWETNGGKSNVADSRYIVVDSPNAVACGDMTDNTLPAHKTMNVSAIAADTEALRSSKRDQLPDSAGMSSNDFQHSSVSVITFGGGDSSSKETATDKTPVRSDVNVNFNVSREESNVQSSALQMTTSPLAFISKTNQGDKFLSGNLHMCIL